MGKAWYKSTIIIYTGIINKNNRNRELAIIGKSGDDKYVVSWYNNKTKRFGVEFFVDKIGDNKFIYKGQEYDW